MLDQLMDSISGDVINNLTEKAGVSADQAKSILPIATESIQSGLMEQVTGGNIAGILGMFNSSGSGLTSNPIFGTIKQMFLGKLMSKMGLPSGVANMVAGSGLESIMGSLTSKLSGDDGQVTQDGLMDKLGLGGGMADMAKGMLGDKLGDVAKGKLGDIAGGLFK